MDEILSRLEPHACTLHCTFFGGDEPRWSAVIRMQIGAASISSKHHRGPTMEDAVVGAWGEVKVIVEALS